jgi:hypothetical protein
MRLGLVIMVAVLGTAAARPAQAEPRSTSARAASALEVTLLDGWRVKGAELELGRASVARKEAPEPGQEFSLAVERMWSQVRAYRRPGGAELIVRGRF